MEYGDIHLHLYLGLFGKLSLEMGSEAVLSTIVFISDESEIRKNRIITEIEHPTKRDR